MVLAVWCSDQAGPYQPIPYPGQSWRASSLPPRLPQKNLRAGTPNVLTLFRPATGPVRLKGITACPNAVLHPCLKRELSAILDELPGPHEAAAQAAEAVRAAWER